MHDGVVDFCFTARGFTAGLEKRVVYHDELVALLPAAHPLTAKEKVTLADLASEPFVLLDEGEQSLVLDAFAAYGLSPHVTSEVTDDYTIMAMVEEGLGVSMLYRRTVEGGPSCMLPHAMWWLPGAAGTPCPSPRGALSTI